MPRVYPLVDFAFSSIFTGETPGGANFELVRAGMRCGFKT